MTKRKGHKLSAATKAKISAKLKGKKHPGHKGTHKGHPMSAATRAKISAALKGRHTAGHKGHAMSSATRAKISAALKGKHHAGHPMSAATKAKISAALKGKPHKGHPLSAASRAKISASLLARHGRTTPLHPVNHTPGAKRARTTHHGTKTGAHKQASLHRPAHPKSRTGGRRGLISAHTRRHLKGFLHKGIRHHRHRPVLRRRARAHRVWKRRRRSR